MLDIHGHHRVPLQKAPSVGLQDLGAGAPPQDGKHQRDYGERNANTSRWRARGHRLLQKARAGRAETRTRGDEDGEARVEGKHERLDAE